MRLFFPSGIAGSFDGAAMLPGLSGGGLLADLSSPWQADAFAKEVLGRCGGHVDVLVNNAGVAQQKLFQDITDSDWRHVMGVNLDGVFYVTRSFLPAMNPPKKRTDYQYLVYMGRLRRFL